MKIALALLALTSLGLSAPQPRKLFHEHLEDFIGIILAESGHDFEKLLEHYGEKEDFWFAISYLKTTNFRDILYEVESLLEFKNVTIFLEREHIDIRHFIENINELIDYTEKTNQTHDVNREVISSLLRESVNLLPKEKLAALFVQKKAEDGHFKSAMESLRSREWDTVYGALWASEAFQKNIHTLRLNGIDVKLVVEEIKAVFGQ